MNLLLFYLGLCRAVSHPYLCRPFVTLSLSKIAERKIVLLTVPIIKWDKVLPEEVRQGSPCGERLKGFNLILGKMPKVKTNSSAKKRFKVTATGKIMHQKSFKRHILTKKSKKRKRNMRKDGEVAKSHVHFVKTLLRLK